MDANTGEPRNGGAVSPARVFEQSLHVCNPSASHGPVLRSPTLHLPFGRSFPPLVLAEAVGQQNEAAELRSRRDVPDYSTPLVSKLSYREPSPLRLAGPPADHSLKVGE